MISITAKPRINLRSWIAQFEVAIRVGLIGIGDWVEDRIKADIEGTWDNKFPVQKIVDSSSGSLFVIWGDSGDQPGEVSGGGDLMAIVPRGSQWNEVAKTKPGILKSKATFKSWVAINQVVGEIVPRNFDDTIIKELEKKQSIISNSFNKGLKQAGLT